MSTTLLEADSHSREESPGGRPDSLAHSVLLMLSLIVAQRLIGFVRTIMFCRWLDPCELGEWDVALGFFSLAAPLAALGVSGSFGRYVGHFRQAGTLKSFIRRTATFAGAALILWCLLLLRFPESVSQFVFGRPDQCELVSMLVAGLVAVVGMNFVNDLLNGLRLFRVSSLMQLVQGVGFAAFGIGLVWGWQRSAFAVMAAYVAATLLAGLVGASRLAKDWPGLPDSGGDVSRRDIFRRIASFAGWMWLTNALANLFSYADRYVMLHYCGLSQDDALVLVGNYHTARVLPLLMCSVTVTVAGAMLPHLSHDWERGRRREVSDSTCLTLKLFSLGLTLAGLAVLLAAPLLFDLALHGKFSAGKEVLAWTLLCGVWVGMQAAVYNYLWCAERPRLVSLAILGGLSLNVGLNLFLVPRLGLTGAVWGTSLSNLAVLGMVLALSRLVGLRLDARLAAAVVLPLILCLPPWLALSLTLVLGGLAWRTNGFLSKDEKTRLAQLAIAGWNKLRRLRNADRALETASSSS